VTLAEYAGRNVLLVFYLGEECVHCMEQLRLVGKRKADFERLGAAVLAVSRAAPAANAGAGSARELGFRLLSDQRLENARRFQSYDEFEELELHSTILLDAQGRVRWARHGGPPFTDVDFLLGELERMGKTATP
jgi:peroxiredoxin